MGMYGLTYSLYHPEGNSDFILLYKSNSLLLECLLVVWNKLFCLTTAATGSTTYRTPKVCLSLVSDLSIDIQ